MKELVVKLTPQPEGWSVIENNPVVGEPTVKLVSILTNGQECQGEKLLVQAQAMGRLGGLEHLERLSKKSPCLLDLCVSDVLGLGTIWADPDGHRYTPVYRKSEDEVCAGWRRLDGVFRDCAIVIEI